MSEDQLECGWGPITQGQVTYKPKIDIKLLDMSHYMALPEAIAIFEAKINEIIAYINRAALSHLEERE